MTTETETEIEVNERTDIMVQEEDGNWEFSLNEKVLTVLKHDDAVEYLKTLTIRVWQITDYGCHLLKG